MTAQTVQRPQVASSSKKVVHRTLRVVLCAGLPLAILLASIGITVSSCGQEMVDSDGSGGVVRCTGSVFLCILVALVMGSVYGSPEALSPAGCVIVLFLVLICGEAWLNAVLPLMFKWDDNTSKGLRIAIAILASLLWLMPLGYCCCYAMPEFYKLLLKPTAGTQDPVVAPRKTAVGEGTSPAAVPLQSINVQSKASTSNSQDVPKPEVIFEAPEQAEWGAYQCPNNKHTTDGPCECQPFTSDKK